MNPLKPHDVEVFLGAAVVADEADR